MRLWLVRHAQPLIEHGICYGQLDIVADTDATQHAAQRLTQALQAERQTQYATQKILIQVSALQRAQQLAQQLITRMASSHAMQQFITDPRLNEMNFGTWEGHAWTAIPATAVDAWTADFSGHRFGGKESASEVIQRVARAYEQAVIDAKQQDITDIIWITHAGVIRALEFYLQTGEVSIRQASDWPKHAPKFGEWIVKNIA